MHDAMIILKLGKAAIIFYNTNYIHFIVFKMYASHDYFIPTMFEWTHLP